MAYSAGAAATTGLAGVLLLLASCTTANVSPAPSSSSASAVAEAPDPVETAAEQPSGSVAQSPTSVAPSPDSTAASAVAREWATATFGTFEPEALTGVGRTTIYNEQFGAAVAGFIDVIRGDSLTIDAIHDASSPRENSYFYDTKGASFGLHSFGGILSLEIYSEAPWDIRLSPVESAPPLPTSGAGNDETLTFLYDGAGGDISMSGAGGLQVLQTFGPNRAERIVTVPADASSGSGTLLPGPSVVLISGIDDFTFRTG